VPCPDGLVVKNGSNKCVRVVSSIPAPVSLMLSITCLPGPAAQYPGCARRAAAVSLRSLS